jgi:hypothetical protein
MTLTLTVRNSANPRELVKPDLRKLPEFAGRFQVLDRDPPPASPGASEVQFTYGLRPRSAEAKSIPALTYVYYRKSGPEEAPTWTRLTTVAKSQAIDVTVPAAPAAPQIAPVPLVAPDEFFAIADDREGARTPGQFAWLLPVAAVPVLVIVSAALCRWLFPDAARLARLRRNRAARLALERLKRARADEDSAGTAAVAFREYLVARYGMPPAAQTPAEVAAALEEIELPSGRAADAESLLRSCDAARFNHEANASRSLARQAEALIAQWEGVSE